MATLDVLTRDEAKAALNIPVGDPSQDQKIDSYVTAVSLALDRIVGPIVQRTITDEPHDGGRGVLSAVFYPIISITSITERQGTTAVTLTAENFASPTANDYSVNLEAGLIYRRSGGCDRWFSSGRGNVRLTYVAGRFADTASVDARFKQGAAIMLSHLWRNEQGIPSTPEGAPVTLTFAVPNAVKHLLADQLLAPVVG